MDRQEHTPNNDPKEQTRSKVTVRQRQKVEKHSIVVLNTKGGCGKTTIATNLASYFANHDHKPALLDFDPQGSSSHWLSLRDSQLEPIFGIKAFKKPGLNTTRTQQLATPYEVDTLIYDTPGNMQGIEFERLIEKAHFILIPVQPSPIDIHAATRFIQNLLLNPYFKRSQKKVAIIANRAKENTLMYSKLRLFLHRLEIPMVSTVRDTQNYVKAFESGRGISELGSSHKKDSEQWEILAEWINKNRSRTLKASQASEQEESTS